MKISGLGKQNFGKIYANKKDLEREIKKLNPNIRGVTRKAIKQADEFNHYDMYVKSGKVIVMDRNFDIPIIEKTLFEGDKGVPFYKALSYLYKKESMEDIYNALVARDKKEPPADTMLRLYKKAAMSGVIEEGINSHIQTNVFA